MRIKRYNPATGRIHWEDAPDEHDPKRFAGLTQRQMERREAGDMSTSDGLGRPITEMIAEREGVRQAVNEIERPSRTVLDLARSFLREYQRALEDEEGDDAMDKADAVAELLQRL